MDATYELVVLQPEHFNFMPLNSDSVGDIDESDPPASESDFTQARRLGPGIMLPTHSDSQTQNQQPPDAATEMSGKFKPYVLSPDGALREGPDNNTPRPPPFGFPAQTHTRKSGEQLNPFMVVLNADFAFRRYRDRLRVTGNIMDMNSALCQDYIDLVNLTDELVDKIYHRPILEWANHKLRKRALRHGRLLPPNNSPPRSEEPPSALSTDLDRRDADLAEDKGKDPAANGNGDCGSDSTTQKGKHRAAATQREATNNSRLGKVVRKPGKGASLDDVVEYYQFLMSGCGE